MDIELRLLRSFTAIYTAGSVSRAASQMACTQAAMSMRLKLLEEELAEPLFLRRHHRLEPTSKGTEFYHRALAVLAAYDAMMTATRTKKSRTRIHIGVPDDYALGILPPVLEHLKRAADYEIEISCDLSANLAASIEQRQLDLAVVTLASRPSGAVFEAGLGLRWVRSAGAVPHLAGSVPLAAYPEGCVFRRAMIAALENANLPWHVQALSRTHAGIVAAVRAGLAVTSMAAGTAPSGLEEVEGGDRLPPLPRVPLYLLAAGPSEACQLMQEELAVLAGPGNWRAI